MKPKIIVENRIPFIKGRLEPVAEVVYAAATDITPELVRDADALVVRTRTKCNEQLLGGSGVKLVVTATIGMDHLDLDWLEKSGISVANAAGCNAPGVAQYVWSSLLRNSFDTSKHTLGVVGYGHIGSIVADWGRKMGANVLVCDPPRKVMNMADENYLPLETLLKECEAITLHTPLTHSGDHPTFHLISVKELRMMKSGSVLINASRGSVVDNNAWREHLRSYDVKAVIDVWENEPNLDTELLKLAEIATPHIAGYSLEGKERATRMALEAIENKFGLTVDKSGLTQAYTIPQSVSGDIIIGSYDPYVDASLLCSAPSEFECLRDAYDLRHEPIL